MAGVWLMQALWSGYDAKTHTQSISENYNIVILIFLKVMFLKPDLFIMMII